MFRSVLFLVVVLFIVSCSGGTSEAEKAPNAPEPATAPIPVEAPSPNGTLLCEINGVPWHYTKASGIIMTERKTGKRTALFTFKKKLDKGSENLQLYYDAATNEIEKITLELKFPKAGGGRHTDYYNFSNESHVKKLPGSSMEGSIDLSNDEMASGTANVTKISIRYEADQLANSQDAVISVTDLRFSEVGYSDLTAVKNGLGI